jgi:hypothetical protein
LFARQFRRLAFEAIDEATIARAVGEAALVWAGERARLPGNPEPGAGPV